MDDRSMEQHIQVFLREIDTLLPNPAMVVKKSVPLA